MNHHERWAKRASDQRKRQEILRWLASFTVTAVVAVVAFVLPSPPVAEFLRLETFGNAIYFETSVRDADQAILEGTLKIRLEAPLYSEERSLSPGRDSGAFSDLPPGKTYTITILADQGFGPSYLARQSLNLFPESGGRITGHELWKTETPQEQWTLLYYRINTLVVDPVGAYRETWLEGAIGYEEEIPIPPGDDEFLPLEPEDGRPGSYLLPGLPDENARIYLRFYALTLDGETVLLDQNVFSTPLKLYASLYVRSAERRAIEVVFYPDSRHAFVEYDLLVSRNGRVLQTLPLSMKTESEEGEPHMKIRVTGLAPSTEYRLELRARYVDPESSLPVSRIIESWPVATLGDFQTTWEFVEEPGSVNVHGVIDDPDGQLRQLSWQVYTVLPDGREQWFSYGFLTIEPVGENGGETHGLIPIPEGSFVIRIEGYLIISDSISYSLSLAEYESIHP